MPFKFYRGPGRRSVRLRNYDYAQPAIYFITICAYQKRHLFGKIINKTMILNGFGQIIHDEWHRLPERWPHLELGVFQVMPNHFHAVLIVHRPVAMVVLAGVAISDGAISDGAISDGAISDGAISDGAISDGATTRVAPTGPNNCKIKTPIPSVRATLVVAPSTVVHPEITFTKIQWATRPTLGQIIGAWKSIVENRCRQAFQQKHPGQYHPRIWQRSFDERAIRNPRAFANISRYIIQIPENWKEDDLFHAN